MKHLAFRKGHPDSPVGQPGRFQVESYSYIYSIDNQDADHFCRFSLCFSASTRISRMFFFSILWKFITKQAFRHHLTFQGLKTGVVFYPYYGNLSDKFFFHNHLTSQGLNTGVLLLDLERMRNSSEYNFFTTQVLPGWFSFYVTHIDCGWVWTNRLLIHRRGWRSWRKSGNLEEQLEIRSGQHYNRSFTLFGVQLFAYLTNLVQLDT